MGGLTYLEGCDAFGRQMGADFAVRSAVLSPEERLSASGGIGKDLSALVSRYNTRGLVADYEVGDVVIHTSSMIHAATQNNSREGRMRLRTDIRYQHLRDEMDARWQKHWTLEDMLEDKARCLGAGLRRCDSDPQSQMVPASRHGERDMGTPQKPDNVPPAEWVMFEIRG